MTDLNWLDRGISIVSPKWALSRAAHRAMLDLAVRSYDAAKVGRRTEGWNTGGTGPNAEIGPAATYIRNRARDLVRNNPFAATVVRKLATKTIGTGIVPRLKVDDAGDRRRADAARIWESFVDNCDPERRNDLYGLQSLLARTVYESGEALIRYLPQPGASRMLVPLQIEILEADYLDSSRDRALDGGGAIIQGIEYNSKGQRVAYWMFDEHPGESHRAFTRVTSASKRVPADRIEHVFETLRPGQARGVSMFTPVVLKLRDVDEYDDAELVRKKVASCFAAFVKRTPGLATSPLAAADAVTTTTGTPAKRIERVSPGMIQYLNTGEEVDFGSPPTADGYVEYMRSQLRSCAAGCGVTYEMATGDLSDVNYSSMRIGMVDFFDVLDHLQWNVFIRQSCRPIWDRVGQIAEIRGLRSAEDPWTPIWQTPKRRMLDPASEVKANAEAVRSGFKSLADVLGEDGEDAEEKLVEIARFNKTIDRLELVLDTDPRKVGKTSAAAPATNGDAGKTADEKDAA